jgi:hypothetical protein
MDKLVEGDPQIMPAYCPYCNTDLHDELYNSWNGDWMSTDDFDCALCKQPIHIEVHIEVDMEPHFIITTIEE